MFLVIVAILLAPSITFKFTAVTSRPRLQPLFENFFLGIGENPEENTPKELYGEVAYQNFIRSTNTKGLLTEEYNLIGRLRETQLLGLIAESGLLEELEKKGLTLSKLEKLLPLVDELRLLELVYKNKDLVLSLSPLLVEPAPIVIPLVVAMLKVPAETYTAAGIALVGLSGYEIYTENGFLAAPLLLLAAPLLALGNLFRIPPPKQTAMFTIPKVAIPTARVAQLPSLVVEKVVSAKTPQAKATPPTGTAGATRVRKTVKIN